MPAKLPHIKSAYMTDLHLSVPKHLKKFLTQFQKILKRNYKTINVSGEDQYTCGQEHHDLNPNWKPFIYFEAYCRKEGLDDLEARSCLEKHLGRRIICECQILIDEKEFRKRDFSRQFGIDFNGIELAD